MLLGERSGLYYGADITIGGGSGSVMVDPKGNGYSGVYYENSSTFVINYGENGAIVSGLPPLFPEDKAKSSLGGANLEIVANATNSIKINGVELPNIVANAFTIPLQS